MDIYTLPAANLKIDDSRDYSPGNFTAMLACEQVLVSEAKHLILQVFWTSVGPFISAMDIEKGMEPYVERTLGS